MNITSFEGYITSYVKWPEGYIPWHVELFRSCLSLYTINCLLNDLQQIESKNVFIYSLSGKLLVRQASRMLQGWSILLVSSSTLVVVGYGLLLCLLPVKGLKLGNILVLRPTILAVPCIILIHLALFVPIAILTLFLVGTSSTKRSSCPRYNPQTPCPPQQCWARALEKLLGLAQIWHQ